MKCKIEHIIEFIKTLKMDNIRYLCRELSISAGGKKVDIVKRLIEKILNNYSEKILYYFDKYLLINFFRYLYETKCIDIDEDTIDLLWEKETHELLELLLENNNIVQFATENLSSKYMKQYKYSDMAKNTNLAKSISVYRKDFINRYYKREKEKLDQKKQILTREEKEFYDLIDNFNEQLLFNLFSDFENRKHTIKKDISDLMGFTITPKKHGNPIFYKQVHIDFNLSIPKDILLILRNIPPLIKQWVFENNSNKIIIKQVQAILKNKDFINQDLGLKLNEDAINYTSKIFSLLDEEYNPKNIFIKLLKEKGNQIFGRYISYSDKIPLLGVECEGSGDSEIIINIASIIIYSILLNCNPSDLLYIIIAHETAHLSSHKGYDTNNTQWRTELFHNYDNYIKEGIAQYYSLVYSESSYEMHNVFAELLTYQGEEYTDFVNWINLSGKSNEGVRAAIREARKKVISYDRFKSIVKQD